MSLQLLTQRQEPVSLARALVRYASALAFLIAPMALAYYVHWSAALLILLPFAWTLFDGDRQALYDRIAGTRLVRTPD